MTVWWWIRHGPTHEKTFVGWRDVPADLSDTAQIARLDAYLPKDALLVSSDLIRASATADAIQKTRTRLPNTPQLREFNFGDWDGLKFDEISRRNPKLSRAYWETPGDIAPPNGESWNQAAARVNGFVRQINATYPDQHIIAVAHIGVIMTQVQIADGLSACEVVSHSVDNLSVTRLEHHNNSWKACTINHLP
ncbi:MAG: histidine phosphatase family protein [Rhodobacterales bacterium]|nr:MAG: histidine phosphatase family protein [Rhodobacterales bacterium]